jgi:hypothetical protein
MVRTGLPQPGRAPARYRPATVSSRSIRAAAIGGLLLGALATGLVLLAFGGDPEPAVAPTDSGGPATSTTTTAPPWVSPLEARIGPAAVVPTTLTLDGDEVRLVFDTYGLVPTGAREGFPGRELPAAPDRWTLLTTSGDVEAEAPAHTAGGITFTVPAGFTLDDVLGVRIDRYRVAVPMWYPLDIAAGDAAWHEAGPEFRVRLADVLEQRENFLVFVEVEGPAGLVGEMSVEGRGRDWVSASRSMIGSNRVTLDFRGAELPDPLPLVALGVEWVPVEAAIELDLSGVSR